jgi:hypothetical protein
MTAWFVQSDATRIPLADASVDLVFGSPPYMDARTYGIGAHRECDEWVTWMLGVVRECCRVSRGLVLINCGGVTRDRCYWPGCEGLLWEWWKQGGQCWRPAYWHRVGIPGSGGKQWLRADVEYILAFKRDAEWLDWADNTANGHPPKWAPGGEMSHRLTSGMRVNQWGKTGSMTGTTATGNKEKCTIGKPRPSHRTMTPFGPAPTKANMRHEPHLAQKRTWFTGARSKVRCGNGSRRQNGEHKEGGYDLPVLANPGNVVKVIVGGGAMGSKLAHENEAPFPEALAEWFIKGWCKPGGIVLDPFSGSGTTVAVAKRMGRVGIGCDLRMNQCELGRRRVNEPVKVKKPRKPQCRHTLTLFGAA